VFLRRFKEREKFIKDDHQQGKKMIMIVKTPGSQMGSPAAKFKACNVKVRTFPVGVVVYGFDP